MPELHRVLNMSKYDWTMAEKKCSHYDRLMNMPGHMQVSNCLEYRQVVNMRGLNYKP